MATDDVQYVTFTLGANMILTNPVDIITEMLRYYVLAPKNYNDELLSPNNVGISLTDTISRYETNKNTLIEVITKELTEAFRDCFLTADSIDVGVTTEDINPYCYTLSISPFLIINGTMYGVSKTLMSYKGNLSFVNDNLSPMEWLEMLENGDL
ncbi:MAG: hypothetical protein J6S85_06880 [Methanobrevibacter sp.]|nr:hypothetical protein [Methanobrevibacter sp.]